MIVKRSGRHIKRLTDLSINGPVVYGTVRTNSGLSEWDFKLDFNDYGHITGRYWLIYGNEDSSIPIKVAEKISSMIGSFPKEFDKAKSASIFGEYVSTNKYENTENDTDAWKNINFESMMQQAKLFKDRKRKRTKKRIKIFFGLSGCCILLIITFFAFDKYREKQKCIEVGISSLEALGKDYNQIIEELKRTG